jgi:hypothetical protein
MWIQTTYPEVEKRFELLCDECGEIFHGDLRQDRKTYWREANIAGWARVSRSPERHICADC